MKTLSKKDLELFQKAILNDYGIKLEGKALYDAAFNLLQFVEAVIIYRKADLKKKGSKVI